MREWFQGILINQVMKVQFYHKIYCSRGAGTKASENMVSSEIIEVSENIV